MTNPTPLLQARFLDSAAQGVHTTKPHCLFLPKDFYSMSEAFDNPNTVPLRVGIMLFWFALRTNEKLDALAKDKVRLKPKDKRNRVEKCHLPIFWKKVLEKDHGMMLTCMSKAHVRANDEDRREEHEYVD